MEFNEQELQIIIQALLKMPAEYSFELLLRIKQYVETLKKE